MAPPRRVTKRKANPPQEAATETQDVVVPISDATTATARLVNEAGAEPTTTGPHDAPEKEAESAEERPEPAAEADDTSDAAGESQEGSEGGPPVAGRGSEVTQDTEPAAAKRLATDQRAGNQPANELVVPPPQPQIPFDRIFQRSTSTMAPHQQAMYSGALVRQLKSLRNVARMLEDGQTAYEAVVADARAAGFPESELEKLAIQYDWRVPTRTE